MIFKQSIWMIIILSLLFGLSAAAADRAGDVSALTSVGTFNDANFAFPDYANGALDILDQGTSKTLSYSCKCANAANCVGRMELQVDYGSGFAIAATTPCSARRSTNCQAQYTHTFDQSGTFEYQVSCKIDGGATFTQPDEKHVTLTVNEPGPVCQEDQTRLCPLQKGVCSGSQQRCSGGEWQACSYGTGYEPIEQSLQDMLDNDCDGYTDGGEDPNKIVVTGAEDVPGRIAIYQYDPAAKSYQKIWHADDPEITFNTGGGEIGDLDGDGINEFVISRATNSYHTLEVWKYGGKVDGKGSWYPSWKKTYATGSYNAAFYVGTIRDLDSDGANELLITNLAAGGYETYQSDGKGGLVRDAVPWDCGGVGPNYVNFIITAADLDGNGYPEITLQCRQPIQSRGKPTSGFTMSDIKIVEFNPNTKAYALKGTVVPPVNIGGTGNMVIDQMETGDVNHDGKEDVVFCGNSGKVHVLTYQDGKYGIAYSTPNVPETRSSTTQSCGVGDLTNDGLPDFYAISADGTMIYTFDGSDYNEVWTSDEGYGMSIGIGASSAGDADNDGFIELLHTSPMLHGTMYVWESDIIDPQTFTFTGSLTVTASSGSNPILGKID